MYSLSGNTLRFSQCLIQKGFFALFPRDIKGIRIDDDDGLALFVSISHGVPGTAGASIPYCENIIGVIYHIPISLVHAIRRIVALEHGFFVALRGNIIIAFSLCCQPLDRLSFAGNGTLKCNAGITSLQIKHDLSRVQINAKSHAGYKVRDVFLFDEIDNLLFQCLLEVGTAFVMPAASGRTMPSATAAGLPSRWSSSRSGDRTLR